MHKVIKKAKEKGCKVVVFDNDGTICHGNFAKKIGYGTLKKEIKNFHIINSLKGFYGIFRIYSTKTDNNGYEKNARKLKILFDSLGNARCLDRELAYRLAEEHLENVADGFGSFVEEARNEIGPALIASMGCQIGPDIVRRKYGLDGQVSNPVEYILREKKVSEDPIIYLKDGKIHGTIDFKQENPMISGCRMLIRNPEEKEHYVRNGLEILGHELEEALFIFNDGLDLPTAKSSRFPVACPTATSDARNVAKYIMKSYVS